ncbi:MAG: hypothetical protein CBC82_06830 [Cellvibrionales bacterium TMED122]|nr:MAG: hypothetical protein CBC82_06830 [Cellvibrionales bacterium TMED122]
MYFFVVLMLYQLKYIVDISEHKHKRDSLLSKTKIIVISIDKLVEGSQILILTLFILKKIFICLKIS